MLIREQAIASVELDPRHETADADFSNNFFPSQIRKSRIELYRSEREDRDLMADMLFKLRERKSGDEAGGRKVPLEPSN